jgi:uncharacterized metal-binding protein YceD (DUF177 family)
MCVGVTVKVDIASVLRAGRELVFEQSVPVPEFASRAFPEPAAVRLTIKRLDRELDISGTIEATYIGTCDRCLGDVRRTTRLDVEERFTPTSDNPFAESNVLDGTMLDVDDLVRQLIDAALPLTVLCSDACPGLCAACGQKKIEACTCRRNSPGRQNGQSKMENAALKDAQPESRELDFEPGDDRVMSAVSSP